MIIEATTIPQIAHYWKKHRLQVLRNTSVHVHNKYFVYSYAEYLLRMPVTLSHHLSWQVNCSYRILTVVNYDQQETCSTATKLYTVWWLWHIPG